MGEGMLATVVRSDPFSPRNPYPMAPRWFRLRLGARTAGLVALAILAAAADRVIAAQQGTNAPKSRQGGAEDDPFADELNPLGPGRPRPATPGAARPETPTPRPIPDAPKVPPEPPAGRPLTPKDAAADRGRRERALPLPFPEAGDDLLDGTGARTKSPVEPFLVEAEKLEKAKNYRDAAAVLEKAVAADPKSTVAHLALGMVRRRLGDLKGAIVSYSNGLKVDEFDPALLFRRGIAWFRLGEYRIALEDFDDASGLSFDDPMPEMWKGLTLMELDRPREAIVAYSAAIQKDRSVMDAYLNRGLAYLVVGEPDKAETDFELAIRRDPADATAWFNRGVAQARQREYANAATSFQRALVIDPAFEAARRNLGAVQARASGSGG
jgi:tetratricopeptide (TPR) repeat protein